MKREPDAPLAAARQGPHRGGAVRSDAATCFTSLDLVFFDTTSLFFTGNGGDTLGQYGKSKGPPQRLQADGIGDGD